MARGVRGYYVNSMWVLNYVWEQKSKKLIYEVSFFPLWSICQENKRKIFTEPFEHTAVNTLLICMSFYNFLLRTPTATPPVCQYQLTKQVSLLPPHLLKRHSYHSWVVMEQSTDAMPCIFQQVFSSTVMEMSPGQESFKEFTTA